MSYLNLEYGLCLPSEVTYKPQDKGQDDGDDYAACYRNINSPVFRAKLQISGQFEQADSAEQHEKCAEQCYYNPCNNQPLTDLLRSKIHR